MKTARVALFAPLCLAPAFAQAPQNYAYEYPSLLNPYSSSQWTSNGTNSASTNLYTSSATNGGSLIFNQSIAAPSTFYEVHFKLSLPSAGGNYFVYLRASSNAQYVSGNTGTYYAVEIANPTGSGGNYSATLNFIKSVSGSVSTPYTTSITPSNGSDIRIVMSENDGILVYLNNKFWTSWADQSSPITSGQPGVGVSAAPSGNGFNSIDIGQLDTTPPNTVNTQLVGTSASPNRVDIQFPDVLDQNVTPPGATGVAYYQFFRNGNWLSLTGTPNFEDHSVQPSTNYTYLIEACDFHANCSSASINVTTPPSGAIDPREVGVRPTGTYWGADGENIDMRSANLNFTIPLLNVMSRNGKSYGFNLSYNSQNWRQDPGGTWQFGRDLGYGYGWRLSAGSITPIYDGIWQLDHYEFTDSTGAQYRLDQNNNGVWSSKESIYVYYDSNTGYLHFTDGSFWTFGCTSAGTEQDSGTMYPMSMFDSNGNWINIVYEPGVGLSTDNTSSRIYTISDVRSYGGNDYTFTYNNDPIPHLTGISNTIGTSENYTFSYSENQPLNSPFSPPTGYGNWTFLSSVKNGVPLTTSFTYDSTGTGELDAVTFPYQGQIGWTYGSFNYSGTRTYREVQGRSLTMAAGATALNYGISYQTTSGITFHTYSQVDDPDGNSEKAFFFDSTTGDSGFGLQSALDNRPHHYPNTAGGHYETYTWTTDPAGNPYLGTALVAEDHLNPTEVDKKTVQTKDQYGNVTQMQIFDYNFASTPMRTYTNTYLNSSSYTSLYILNRLATSTVTDGTYTTTLANNSYDQTLLTNISSIYNHYSGYGTSWTTRGNVTTSVTPAGTKTMAYDIAGNVLITNNNNLTTTANVNSNTSYTMPSSITTNSLTSSMNWSNFLGLTSATGPNGDNGTIGYNGAARPTTSTSPLGASTTYTYNDTASPPNKIATTNGHWVQTNMDGFGRTIRTQTGNGTTVISTVDTQYVPCGCSPLGKVGQVSQPYAPGGTVYWTVYHYDGLGRTTSSVAPDGSTTSYSYSGNQVKVTDPAGKYKTFIMNGVGNLVQVWEPDPTLGSVGTGYAYDMLNHLVQVGMTRGSNVQYRTFNYVTGSSVGIDLLSATNPENGTVTYTYNTDHTLATKVDANGNSFAYTYDNYKRLTQIKVGSTVIRTFMYDTNTLDSTFSGLYTAGRLVAVQNASFTPQGYVSGQGGNGASVPSPMQFVEMFGYTQAGLTSGKRLQVNETFNYYINGVLHQNPQTLNLDGAYTYDTEGKMTSVSYPSTLSYNGTQQVITTGPKYTYSFDAMDRPTGLTDQNNNADVSNVTYNPANQLLTLNYFGTAETRQYNSFNQMTSLTQGSSTITYTFPTGTNNGKISQQSNSVSGETVTYQYDSLNRLLSASGSGWSETYGYDGFGNLLTKTPTGSAPTLSQSVNAANNQVVGWTYDANGNQTLIARGVTGTYDAENRLVAAGGMQYGYDSRNKRVWSASISGNTMSQTVFAYGANGQKLGAYSFQVILLSNVTPTLTDSSKTLAVYFGGKRVGTTQGGGTGAFATDRLGSNGSYYPYGEARGTVPQDDVGFATYTNDSATGLEYADQRYYASNFGRFMSPDPYTASGGPADPRSWNRYSYTRGDPVNRFDPWGLEDLPQACVENPEDPGGCPGPPSPGPDPTPGKPNCSGTAGVFACGGGGGGRSPADKNLAAAIAAALKDLSYPKCAALYGTAATRANGFNPVDVLTRLQNGQSLEPSGASFFAGYALLPLGPFAALTLPTPAAPTGPYVPANVLGGTITLFNSTLFNDSNDTIQQELTVLHELGHTYNYLPFSGGASIRFDIPLLAPGVGDQNDSLIMNNCLVSPPSK